MEAVLVSSPFRAHPAHAMVRNVIRLIRPNDGSPSFLHGGARKASCAHTAPQTPCASQKRRLRRQPRCLTPDKWSVARSLGSRSLLPRVAMLVVLAPRAFLLPTSTRWVSSPMSALSFPRVSDKMDDIFVGAILGGFAFLPTLGLRFPPLRHRLNGAGYAFAPSLQRHRLLSRRLSFLQSTFGRSTGLPKQINIHENL